MEVSAMPSNLNEAMEAVIDFCVDLDKHAEKLSENDFVTVSHHSAGQFVRNSWNLWWYENHGYKGWPKEKPALVEFFNDLGIVHPDDMSGIIFTSIYRKLKGKDINLKSQVEYYHDFWKKEGFPDGKPKVS